MLGAKGIGKTTIINYIKRGNCFSSNVEKTASLNITKLTREFSNYRVKLEFIDTNEEIQASSIIKSKFVK